MQALSHETTAGQGGDHRLRLTVAEPCIRRHGDNTLDFAARARWRKTGPSLKTSTFTRAAAQLPALCVARALRGASTHTYVQPTPGPHVRLLHLGMRCAIRSRRTCPWISSQSFKAVRACIGWRYRGRIFAVSKNQGHLPRAGDWTYISGRPRFPPEGFQDMLH